MKWIINEKTSKDHWLEILLDDGSKVFRGLDDEIGKPLYRSEAVCKWDGCVDLRRYSNAYGAGHKCQENCPCLEEYIHICDVDQFIKELQELKKIASEYYKGKTGEDYWNES